jgi:hypothetical protein
MQSLKQKYSQLIGQMLDLVEQTMQDMEEIFDRVELEQNSPVANSTFNAQPLEPQFFDDEPMLSVEDDSEDDQSVIILDDTIDEACSQNDESSWKDSTSALPTLSFSSFSRDSTLDLTIAWETANLSTPTLRLPTILVQPQQIKSARSISTAEPEYIIID